jgi:hypothetical protein
MGTGIRWRHVRANWVPVNGIDVSTPQRKVSPMQVAAQLLEGR